MCRHSWLPLEVVATVPPGLGESGRGDGEADGAGCVGEGDGCDVVPGAVADGRGDADGDGAVVWCAPAGDELGLPDLAGDGAVGRGAGACGWLPGGGATPCGMGSPEPPPAPPACGEWTPAVTETNRM